MRGEKIKPLHTSVPSATSAFQFHPSGGGLGVVWGWSGGSLGLPPEFPRWCDRHTRCICIHLLFGRTDKRTDGIVKIGDERTNGRTDTRTHGHTDTKNKTHFIRSLTNVCSGSKN